MIVLVLFESNKYERLVLCSAVICSTYITTFYTELYLRSKNTAVFNNAIFSLGYTIDCQWSGSFIRV